MTFFSICFSPLLQDKAPPREKGDQDRVATAAHRIPTLLMRKCLRPKVHSFFILPHLRCFFLLHGILSIFIFSVFPGPHTGEEGEIFLCTLALTRLGACFPHENPNSSFFEGLSCFSRLSSPNPVTGVLHYPPDFFCGVARSPTESGQRQNYEPFFFFLPLRLLPVFGVCFLFSSGPGQTVDNKPGSTQRCSFYMPPFFPPSGCPFFCPPDRRF